MKQERDKGRLYVSLSLYLFKNGIKHFFCIFCTESLGFFTEDIFPALNALMTHSL